MEKEKVREQAVQLLVIIWKGIPQDYKSRYRMNIWEQFENQVLSAAYTENLPKFINRLCLKFGAGIGTNAEDRGNLDKLLLETNDREILKILREETAYLILRIRVANQEKRKEYDLFWNTPTDFEKIEEEMKKENDDEHDNI